MAIDWAALSKKLPADRSPESKAARKKIFQSVDVNGNGYLSLAEVDKALRDVLKVQEVFDCKPAIMRAFQAAKNASKGSGVGQHYVELREFRLLLVYLRQYFELHVMFDKIDSSDDHRIDFGEFKKALDAIKTWGLTVADPEAEFKKIDSDRSNGYVLFDEFAAWAIEKKLDLEDDDD